MAKYGEQFYFMMTSNAYLQVVDGTLHFFKSQAIKEVEAGFADKEWSNIWKRTLAAQSRVYLDIAFSFNPLPPTTLNLTDRSVWVKPQVGTPHKVFGYVLDSLGGGKPANADHIEQCVRWKYLHPEDFLLPCLTIYGEGAIGKNLFVLTVLGRLFSPRQVNALRSQSATGRFNESLLGKTVVLIDESLAGKADMEALKQLVGNPTIDVDKKFVAAIVCHNTAWYIIAGNKAPITLSDDKSDRRWSILYVPPGRTLLRVIADKEAMMTTEEGISMTAEQIGRLTDGDWLPYERQAQTWLDAEVWRLSDEREVAVWLYHICDKWKHLTARPVEQSLDKPILQAEQEKSWMAFAKAVFFERDGIEDDAKLVFSHIKRSTYCEMYREYHKLYFQGMSLGRSSLYKITSDWLNKPEQANRISISQKQFKVLDGDHLTTGDYWYRDLLHPSSEIEDNDTRYKLINPDTDRTTWRFPPDAN